jgi:uncharacterized coiled-coil DUF342 family protein
LSLQQARELAEETGARQAAEAELAAARDTAAREAAEAASAASERAAEIAQLRAQLAETAEELASMHAKLDAARVEAERKLREHWEATRCGKSLPSCVWKSMNNINGMVQ